MNPIKMYDVLILGGGPSGMTAGIYAARAGLETCIVETQICGGLVNSAHAIENFPSYISITGMELMQKVARHAECLGVNLDQAAEVISVRLSTPIKQILTDEFNYQARAIVLSTGRKPVRLDIDKGECQQIHYCSVCDGEAYKGKRVIVMGGGNSGFDEACHLKALGVNKIFLIEQMDRFFAAQCTQEKLLSCDNVIATTSTRLVELIGKNRLEAVRLENVRTGETSIVETDGIFVNIGQVPSTELFADELNLDTQGYIITNDNMETNIPGVYAAGDVRQKKYRQITTAISDGTIAALEAELFLRNKI